jgi:hypothetical protein
LRDELKESNQGASSYVQELSRETKELREKLRDAINSEKSAVQNALRTHREFQLAMTNKTPGIAIPWLDDKLFDMAKLLNALLDRLKDKRRKLEESEQMVTVIQKWPRPGTLPWELEAYAAFTRLECTIEAQKGYLLLEQKKIILIHLLHSKTRDGFHHPFKVCGHQIPTFVGKGKIYIHLEEYGKWTGDLEE